MAKVCLVFTHQRNKTLGNLKRRMSQVFGDLTNVLAVFLCSADPTSTWCKLLYIRYWCQILSLVKVPQRVLQGSSDLNAGIDFVAQGCVG